MQARTKNIWIKNRPRAIADSTPYEGNWKSHKKNWKDSMQNSPSAQKRQRRSGQPQAELLQKILDRAGIQKWDLLLIGDGSGISWRDACGWASTLITRWSRDRHVFFGAANMGSVNVAEMMPYLQALTWYHYHAGKAEIKKRGLLQVHVITDSRATVTHGRMAANLGAELPKVPQRALWAGMRELGRMGYNLQWHWARRSTSSLNFLADLIAGLARREILLLGREVQLHGCGDEALAKKAADALDRVQFVDPMDGITLDVNALNPMEVSDAGSPSPHHSTRSDH